MDTRDLCYAAGFFDGEGTISIGTQVRPYGRGRYFSLCCSVANTDESIIQWWNEQWPAHLSTRRYDHPKYQPLHRWQIERKKAAAFLHDIEPFLRQKRSQALLGLELDGMMGPQRMTDEEYERMISIHAEVSALNRRGR